jgi:hypothetical protein
MKPEAKSRRLDALHKELEQTLARIGDEIEANETVREFSNEAQRKVVLDCIRPEETWFQASANHQEQTCLSVASHLAAVNACIAPVYRRIRENASSWEIIQQFRAEALTIAGLMGTWKSTAPVAKLSALLDFEAGFGKTRVYITATLRENAAAPRDDLLPFRPLTLRDRYREFHEAAISLKALFVPSQDMEGGANIDM